MTKPLPTRFVIALFLSAFTMAYLVVHHHQQAIAEQESAFLAVSVEPILRATKSTERSIEQHTSALRNLLDGDSKALFRPMLPTLVDVAKAREDYVERVDLEVRGGSCFFGGRRPTGQTLENLFSKYCLTMHDEVAQLLRQHQRKFGMSKDDVSTRLEAMEKQVQKLQKRDWEQFDDLPFDYAEAVLYLDILNYELRLVEEIVALSCSRTIICDAFFPVFNAESAYFKPGDPIRAKVMVGSYSSCLKPENVNLTVNGERLPINPDGTADFYKVAKGSGRQTLETRVEVTNPLTGMVTTGEGLFTYEVE